MCDVWHNPVSELCRQLLQPYGLAFALICITNCETLDRCVPFQSSLINWIYHMGTPVKVEKHLRDDQENELSRVWILVSLWYFINFFNKLAKTCKILFLPCHYGVLSVLSVVWVKIILAQGYNITKCENSGGPLNISWMHCMIPVLFPIQKHSVIISSAVPE